MSLLLLCLCLLSVGAVPLQRSGRPNILFLMADEMDGRIMDPSSPQLKPPLPNLNGLAASGALFTTAYNQAPQCVPSRSAMMVGLRTDQLRVYDNFVGGIAVNGSSDNPDSYCVQAFNRSACIAMAARQAAVPTFIDRLHNSGYGIHLYGKMHAGFGLDRYPGSIQEFPFNDGSGDAKTLREWTRGVGAETNIKGCHQGTAANRPPDNKPAPAMNVDYKCMDSCVSQLRAGLFNRQDAPQFLYCSIVVPHPPYASNSTYMAAVSNLSIGVPKWVPKDQTHPNDRSTSTLKHLWNTDTFNPQDIIYARRVYFSMCYEADTLLGEILSALDATGTRDQTFVVFISDHSEDNYEHRQIGKNNMYDSGSRVVMMLSGPGVPARQVVPALASLNDIYPTVLDMANITAEMPSALPGSSLLNLVSATQARPPAKARKDYVIAQYHSVFSVTGTFMIRRGELKLILYGPTEPLDGQSFSPQLFNMSADPWELNDIAHSSPGIVKELSLLMASEINITEVDASVKASQRQLFVDNAWKGSANCQQTFESIYGKGVLNSSDAAQIARWIGHPCPFSGPLGPDPTCARGAKDSTGKICCALSCGVCAHPSAACSARPGGASSCCPSRVQKADKSCKKQGAPCVMSNVRRV